MGIKIRMLGLLKKASGRDEIFISSNGELRLKEVIEWIIKEMNALEDILLDPELKDPSPNTIILINGKEMSLLGGLEAKVKDGDEIVIIPVVHGGAFYA